MSLSEAILGLLAEQPLTGYELKTVWFDRTIAHFWAADHTQIYRTLDKLAQQELVSVEVEQQSDRPARKVYHLTAAGRAELQQWLRTPQPPSVVREALQIQLFCGASLTNAELTMLLEGERQAQEARRDAYRAQLERAATYATSNAERARQLRLLTLKRGIQRAESAIEWVDEALATVAVLRDDPGVGQALPASDAGAGETRS